MYKKQIGGSHLTYPSIKLANVNHFRIEIQPGKFPQGKSIAHLSIKE
jgi:hypothetical protein